MDKQISKEDEFFAKQEFERRRKHEEASRLAMAAEEKKRLKDLHFMNCPKCGMKLIEIEYKNIKIDKCSHCEGVWLDVGELDEIVKDKGGKFTTLLKVFNI
ncbi:MAG: zf-TFIIB domain-containing protein [Nitrospinae bacterium]|nr:zf-TFIIB domain-containing protein [Nitrospinota bacterium]